ncbi:MAG: Zn-ribbon domain-containing OB-fold protein [Candidatus Bipolaricaulota bacterium]
MQFRDFSLQIQDTKVHGFVDGLGRGEILASKCSSCGVLQYPPRSDCPHCLGSAFEWVPVSGEGRLISFTSIYVTPKHFTPDLSRTAPFSAYSYQPRPVGIVEMKNGLRVTGWILGVPADALRVGMSLMPRAEILPDGRATVVLARVEG